MDLAGVAAVLGIPAALLLAIWPIVQGRSAISQLEKLVQLSKESEDADDTPSILLREARDSLKVRVAILTLARPHPIFLSWAWTLLGMALVLMGSWVLLETFHPDWRAEFPRGMSVLILAFPGVAGIFFAVGYFLFFYHQILRESLALRLRQKHHLS